LKIVDRVRRPDRESQLSNVALRKRKFEARHTLQKVRVLGSEDVKGFGAVGQNDHMESCDNAAFHVKGCIAYDKASVVGTVVASPGVKFTSQTASRHKWALLNIATCGVLVFLRRPSSLMEASLIEPRYEMPREGVWQGVIWQGHEKQRTCVERALMATSRLKRHRSRLAGSERRCCTADDPQVSEGPRD
jgi:hypothetical protein